MISKYFLNNTGIVVKSMNLPTQRFTLERDDNMKPTYNDNESSSDQRSLSFRSNQQQAITAGLLYSELIFI